MSGKRFSIFPLSGAILFPGLQLPLHIFEPRYRAMVGDALARDRRIAMIQPQDQGRDAPLFEIGCVGRIEDVETSEDGRYNIVLEGESRFRVLRDDGTERAFSSPLNDEQRPGIFTCAGCELPLFTTEMKYDSGTGWPSFFTTIPGSVKTKRDYRYGWTRIEYHCARCGGHQGHVFDDGPPPTRERWCNNGVALQFLPAP